MPVSSLRPAKYNPRKISEQALEGLKKSVQRFGLVQPIVWNKRTQTVIGGHQRLRVLQENGTKKIPVVVVDLPVAEEKALNLTLNNPHIEGEWTLELGPLLEELAQGIPDVYDDLALSKLIGEIPKSDVEIEEDDVPEPPKNPVTQAGDLWTLGRHRLLCGDSTKAEDVEKTMAGDRAAVTYTDPPYGVNYTGGAKPRESLAGDHVGTEIYGRALPHLAIAARDDAALYLWYADAHVAAAAAAAAAAGYEITAQIVWVKNNAQFVSSAHYHGKHEPCFYAHRRGKSAAWYGGNTEVTVWVCDRAARNDYHPTQKPVALAARAIENSSAGGEVVLDLFLGSGATLVAAEHRSRRCFGLEIEPAYCDVVVERWQNLTGEKATRA